MNTRFNPKGSRVSSNYQLGRHIERVAMWFRNLENRLEVLEEHLDHPQPKPKPAKKIGLEEFLDD